MNAMTFHMARLFRTSSQVRFSGVVHEVPSIYASVKVPLPVCIEVCASQEGVIKSRSRWHRDLELLLAADAKKPNDPRTLFYLGQTYECLNDVENAYRTYEHRATLPGWDEENFMTLYRLSGLVQSINLMCCSTIIIARAVVRLILLIRFI